MRELIELGAVEFNLVPKEFYVYFLVLSNEIVYIGRSSRLELRLMSHKNYDKIYVIKCQTAVEAQATERKMIKLFRPCRNKYLMKDKRIQSRRVFASYHFKRLDDDFPEGFDQLAFDFESCDIAEL